MSEPITIAPDALNEPKFNHKDVYLKIILIGCVKNAETGYAEAFPVKLVVEPEQPAHPELEEFAGFAITHWLRPGPDGAAEYKEFCKKFGIEDPYHPDFSTVEGHTVMAQVKSNPGKGENAHKVYHNVYQIQPA